MTVSKRRGERLLSFIRQVWDEGDVDAADDYVADIYTIHHDPGDPWDGRALDLSQFKDRVRKSRAAFPDQKFDIQSVIADKRQVVLTWFWAGAHSGDLPGFPATGRTIGMSGATVYAFDEEDRLTGHWQVTDRLGVYQQLQRNSRDG